MPIWMGRSSGRLPFEVKARTARKASKAGKEGGRRREQRRGEEEKKEEEEEDEEQQCSFQNEYPTAGGLGIRDRTTLYIV